MLAQATYICSEFDAESGFDTDFRHLSGFYNAEIDFDSDDCLLGEPTMVANSSPSQDIVVSSIENLRKLEVLIIQFQQKQQLTI